MACRACKIFRSCVAPDAGRAKLQGWVIAKAAPVGILKIDKGNFGLPLPVGIS
jgi:hypothetical protein